MQSKCLLLCLVRLKPLTLLLISLTVHLVAVLCSTRNAMQQDLNQSLRASFWTRKFPFNPLYLVGGLVVVVVYIILPITLYTSKLKNVCCSADVDTSLACAEGVETADQQDDSANGSDPGTGTGDGDGSNDGTGTGTGGMLRRLLGAAVDSAVEQIGGRMGLERQRGPSASGDPWGHLVVRG